MKTEKIIVEITNEKIKTFIKFLIKNYKLSECDYEIKNEKCTFFDLKNRYRFIDIRNELNYKNMEYEEI